MVRTFLLMEAMDEAGVSVDKWARAIGRDGSRVKRWLNERNASNYLDDKMLETTCELLHTSIESLMTGYVPQPMVPGIWGPTEATSSRYTPEKLTEAYAMLDDQEQEKVTSYIADLLTIHRLFEEIDRVTDSYERRLDQIQDTMIGPLVDEEATVEDFREATYQALYPEHLSGRDSRDLTLADGDWLNERYRSLQNKLVPKGRPRKRDSDGESMNCD